LVAVVKEERLVAVKEVEAGVQHSQDGLVVRVALLLIGPRVWEEWIEGPVVVVVVAGAAELPRWDAVVEAAAAQRLLDASGEEHGEGGQNR
jgi:hypothetical protein